jgi:hypothetical protein
MTKLRSVTRPDTKLGIKYDSSYSKSPLASRLGTLEPDLTQVSLPIFIRNLVY